MTEYATLSPSTKATVAALRALPAQFASKNGGPLRKALYGASKLIRDDAQSRAPIDTGNLKANVYIYRDRNPQNSGATERYIIGVRTKRGQKQRLAARGSLNRKLGRVGRNFRLKGDAYYWHFVEFGTEKMNAQPFMRPAFEANKRQAVAVFSAEFEKGVGAAVRRAKAAAGA